jgi:hypothetical protein
MNSKYFATLDAPEEGLQHMFPVNHTGPTMTARETWTPDGRLTSWDALKTESSHEAMMNLYHEFGEECAARNMIPSFRLFEHWKDSDAIAEDIRISADAEYGAMLLGKSRN